MREPIRITWKGETHTLAEWSKITGIEKDVIYKRLRIYGWNIEKTLTTPTHFKRVVGKCERKSWRDCLECKYEQCIDPNGTVLEGESCEYV